MLKFLKSSSKKAGLPPGSLVHIGEKNSSEVKITVLDFSEEQFEEKQVKDISECFPFKDTPTVTWINIDGLHDTGVIGKICEHYGVHPLIQEDILHTGQRPKTEDFQSYIYIVLNMLSADKSATSVLSEQVSIILGSNFVISFQEKEGDVFDNVRERIRSAKGRIRKMGPDYLAYALIDAVVDNYFAILEYFGERIEGLEENLLANPDPHTLQSIHGLKREMIFLRKSVWPLREVISALQRGDNDIFKETTQIYLRDIYDHTIQVIDTVETFRDMISGMLDTYLSSISNRMNEVMKVLTIIATIFIPLTFIAGIYGMNFDKMPELKWAFGYPLALALMLAVGLLMVFYFRKKKWL